MSSCSNVSIDRSDLENLQFDIGLVTPILDFKAKYSLHQQFKTLKVYVKAVGDISGIFSKTSKSYAVHFFTNSFPPPSQERSAQKSALNSPSLTISMSN